MNSSFPHASHVLPMKGRVLPKADLRQEITAFRLLVWAYRDECVRAASNNSEPDLGYRRNALFMRNGDAPAGRGTINGRLEAHEDALLVDAFVWEWLLRSPVRYAFVTRAAENGKGIVPAADLPPLKALPVYRLNGNMEMIYPSESSHRPCGCAVDYEGVDDESRQRHHELHSLWRAMLTALVGRRFVKWKVTAEGA